MARLARRSAGDRVAALADGLSDDLLALEERAFAACENEMGRAIGRARTRYESAWRAGKDARAVASNASLLRDLSGMHARAVVACRDHVRVLADDVLRLTLTSVAEELLLCEESLANRYAGLADAAIALAGPAVQGLAEVRMHAYDDSAAAARQQWAVEAKKQMLLSAQRDETQETSYQRLFRPDKNALIGNSGRGIWWRAVATLNGASRDVSIRLTNQTRLAAMQAFNEAGALR